MTNPATLLNCARSVMKHQMARQRAVEQELRAWRDLSCHVAEACADLLESLDAFVRDPGSADPETLAYVQAAASSGWQRLSAAGVSVDGNEGDEFDPSKHKSVQETEAGAPSVRRILRTLQHGLVLRGDRVRRAEVVVSGRRSS